MNGVDVARKLIADCPNCRVLVLTVHEDAAYLRQVLEIGVVGYVLKRSASEELSRGIHAVGAGVIYLDPAIADRALGSPANGYESAKRSLAASNSVRVRSRWHD